MRLPIGYALGLPRSPARRRSAPSTGRSCRPSSSRAPDRDALPLPGPRLPGGPGRGSGPGVAQRRQRGGRGRLPGRADRVERHRRGGRRTRSTATTRRRHGRSAAASRTAPSTTCSRPTLPPGGWPSGGRRTGGGRMSTTRSPASAQRRRSPSRPRAALPTGRAPPPRRSAGELVVGVAVIVALAVVTGLRGSADRRGLLIVIVMLHELGPLRGGQAGRHEGDRVLRRVRAPPVVVPAGGDRVRDQGHPPGRLREDPRHDQPRGGRPGRRGPHLPPAAVPLPAAGGGGRLGHALPAWRSCCCGSC